jgi:hypothetical protein
MKHRALMATLLVACLAGCGKVPPPKNVADDPGLPGSEVTEPTPSEPTPSEPTPSEPETGGSKATAPETGKSKATAPEASPAPEAGPAADTDCKKIKKKATCKVTRGCAWRDGPGAGCTDNPIDEP